MSKFLVAVDHPDILKACDNNIMVNNAQGKFISGPDVYDRVCVLIDGSMELKRKCDVMIRPLKAHQGSRLLYPLQKMHHPIMGSVILKSVEKGKAKVVSSEDPIGLELTVNLEDLKFPEITPIKVPVYGPFPNLGEDRLWLYIKEDGSSFYKKVLSQDTDAILILELERGHPA